MILQRLFEQWGKLDAEWNQGKGTQRYFEYMWALRFADLDGKKIIDVGCGEKKFLKRLLGSYNTVYSVDQEIKVVEPYDFASDIEVFVELPVFTHNKFDYVFCISVLEHVENYKTFAKALDKFDCDIIMTFEHGTNETYVTNKNMYEFLSYFENHYLSHMERCPVLADNSNGTWQPLGIILQRNM